MAEYMVNAGGSNPHLRHCVKQSKWTGKWEVWEETYYIQNGTERTLLGTFDESGVAIAIAKMLDEDWLNQLNRS